MSFASREHSYILLDTLIDYSMSWMFFYQEIHQSDAHQKCAQKEKCVCHGWNWIIRILVFIQLNESFEVELSNRHNQHTKSGKRYSAE